MICHLPAYAVAVVVLRGCGAAAAEQQSIQMATAATTVQLLQGKMPSLLKIWKARKRVRVSRVTSHSFVNKHNTQRQPGLDYSLPG